MEISNRDKKLLVYLFAVGIVALVYFLVARPNMDKQQKLLEENDTLRRQISHYSEIYNNQEEYERQIAEAQTEYSETLNKFFGGLNQENTLINIKGIEEATNTWISRISFQDSQIMLGGGEVVASEEGTEEGTEAATDMATPSGELTGLKQDLNLEYSCNYSDFKRFIEYIQNYDQRLFISSINASYSMDTNEVTGSLVLSQYALLGTDMEYTQPDLSNVGLGVDNIFSTLKDSSSSEGQNVAPVETIEKPEDNASGTEDENSGDDDSSDNEPSNDVAEQNTDNDQHEETAPAPTSGNRPSGGGII